MTLRVAVIGCAAMTFACMGDPDPIACDPAPECPTIDEEATVEDVRVFWAEGEKLVLTLDDSPSDIEVVGGEAVFTPDPADPDCMENCAITLKRLRVTLKDVYFISSQDSVRVAGLEVAFAGPSVLENPGAAGSILPVGTATRTCATVQGVSSASVSPLEVDARLTARAVNEELRIEARVPLVVDGSTKLGCQRFPLELSGTISGATSFEQNPTSPEP